MARNAAWLGGVQLAGMLVPLLTIPWLARALGVEAWGRLLYVQSLSAWMSAIVEYGFALSATRALAPVREDMAQCRSHSGAVLAAKLMLALPCVLVYLLCVALLPALRLDLSMAMAGLFLAVLQGLHPMWFFQTLEKLSLISSLDLANRFLSLGLIVALIHRPEQAAQVLWIQVCLQGISTGWAVFLQRRLCGGLTLDFRAGLLALREGLGLFFFRASVTLYTSANGFLLGTFSVARQVAFFGGAEKIVKASLALLMPISQAVYPRINALQGTDPRRARRLTWLAFVATQTLAWVGAVGLVVLAPWLVPVLLGKGFEAAVPVLRAMALLLPLIAASNVFGIQFLLPRRLDGTFNGIILVAGLLNCLLSVLVAPRFGAWGMGWAVVAAELLVTGTMGLKVWQCLQQENGAQAVRDA